MKEVKTKKENKITKITLGILSLLLIIGMPIIIFEKFNHEEKTMTDSKKFAKEYKILDEDNVFKYSTSNEIIKTLEKGTGIIFLGYPECEWCKAYASILNEVAKEERISEILYYNIKEDRDKSTKNYEKITNLLNQYLLYDDEEKYRLYVPDITVVKNGKIIGHNNEGALITKQDGTPEEYWTKDRKDKLKNTLKTYFKKLNS